MKVDPTKCRHCGGKMTDPKPITDGVRAGQTRRICLKCGHSEYEGGTKGALPPEYVQRHPDEL